MAIVNLGRASATDVTVSIDPTISAKAVELPLSLKFARLLPNTPFRLTVGSYPELQSKVVGATIAYSDKFGRHTFEYSQDLTQLLGVSRVSNRPEYASAKSLATIADTLQGATRAGNRLRIDTFSARDRAQERSRLAALWNKEAEDLGRRTNDDAGASDPGV